MNIKLVSEPRLDGGLIAIGNYEFPEWYEAEARDERGNRYRVIWPVVYGSIAEDEDCDGVPSHLGEPSAVFDAHGEDVTDSVIITM